MTSKIGSRFDTPLFEIHPLPKKIDSENMITLFINCVNSKDFGKTGTAMGADLYDMLCSKAKVFSPSDKELENFTKNELVAFYVRSLKLPFTGKIEDGMSDEAGHIALENIRETVVHPIYNLLIKNKLFLPQKEPTKPIDLFSVAKPRESQPNKGRFYNRSSFDQSLSLDEEFRRIMPEETVIPDPLLPNPLVFQEDALIAMWEVSQLQIFEPTITHRLESNLDPFIAQNLDALEDLPQDLPDLVHID